MSSTLKRRSRSSTCSTFIRSMPTETSSSLCKTPVMTDASSSLTSHTQDLIHEPIRLPEKHVALRIDVRPWMEALHVRVVLGDAGEGDDVRHRPPQRREVRPQPGEEVASAAVRHIVVEQDQIYFHRPQDRGGH